MSEGKLPEDFVSRGTGVFIHKDFEEFVQREEERRQNDDSTANATAYVEGLKTWLLEHGVTPSAG